MGQFGDFPISFQWFRQFQLNQMASISTEPDSPPKSYQPTYSHILSINDYEDAAQDALPEENEELPFDEIQEILANTDSITSRREAVLVMAVNYLQERCSELTNSNNYLHQRQQDLMEEISYSSEVEISQETALGFLQAMQRQIDNYKIDFHHYREKSLALRKVTLEEKAKLQSRIVELEGMLAQNETIREGLQQQRNDMMASNEELMQINAQLNEKAADFQDEIAQLRNQAKYYPGSRAYGSRKLEGEIQAELKSLIQKLMGELQSERQEHFKLSGEYKMLQRQVMQLQKEITEKNSRIYQLEMLSLKNNRLSPQQTNRIDKTRQIHQPSNHRAYDYNKNQLNQRNGNNDTIRQDSIRRDKEHSSFKTFSIMTLLNQNVEFSKKTRLIIALKVIEFYLRKIKKGEYTTQMLQNLLVYNYSALCPQACIIRKDKTVPSKEGECSLERLIWNLGFILDNLVNQAQDESQQKTGAELQMVNLINKILEENSCTLKAVDQLKSLAQEAIKLKR